MIYLQSYNDKVTYIHFKPFDAKVGLKKTESELVKTGILVETLPEKLPMVDGKILELYVNPLRWEYVDAPAPVLSLVEKLQQMVNDGKITQEEMNELL